MDLRVAVEQIARWASVSTSGVQDDDIRIFIETAAELSKLPEMEKNTLLMPLQIYFENKKGSIEQFLISEYGKQARAMGNQLHLSVFGRPWED